LGPVVNVGRAAAGGRGKRLFGTSLLATALVLVWACWEGPRLLEAQLPPDQHWHTFDTPNFRVTYPQGLEPLARRAADRAERAHALLSRELLPPPPGRIELVLSDHADFANGFATVFPRPKLVIFTHPPIDSRDLAFYDDWLDLILVHELVHVFHLDRTRGIWAGLRTVFGRHPGVFISGTAPAWVVEGLATQLESRLTLGGRVRGTTHDMILRTAILEEEFFPIDRATGVRTIWPGPATRYVYGSHFFDFLVRRHGQASVSRFLEHYAGTIVPYDLDRPARRAFGRTLVAAWEEWERQLRAAYLPLADSLRAEGLTTPEILTEEGRVAAHPRFSSAGTLAYIAATGRDHPAIRIWKPGEDDLPARVLSTIGSFSWVPGSESIVHDDLEYVGPFRIFSDLYEAPLAGSPRRLTRAARLQQPDVHPDTRRIVAVAAAEDPPGSNALVLYDRSTGEQRLLTEASPDVHWSLPRWSPAGDLIVASRWRPGGIYSLLLLDSAGTPLRELTPDRAIDSGATWSPDGRYLLFSSDRTGIPNLFAVEVATGELRQVTNLLSGAFEPAVSPDGRWIAFSLYRADGYYIARVPFDPEAWREPGPLRLGARMAAVRAFEPAPTTEPKPYRAWNSLQPVGWTPLVDQRRHLGLGIGAALGGRDVVERHVWSAEATVLPQGRRTEGAASYRFRGLGNPILEVSASQHWSVAATLTPSGAALPTPLLERNREAGASLALQRRRWDSNASASLGASIRAPHRAWAEPAEAGGFLFRQRPPDAGAVVQTSYSSARGFGIALGPQQGSTAIVRGEARRYLAPFPEEQDQRGYVRLTGRGRTFQPLPRIGFARQVLAIRLDGGVERGSVSPGFSAGGATGAPLGGTLGIPGEFPLFGRAVGFPIRGYPERAQRGNHVVTASAEYRFPIVRVERGVRVLPFFLERVWGDVFADAGTAWCVGTCERIGPVNPRFDPLPSLGAELNVDLFFGFRTHVPLRFGLAVPLRPSGGARSVPYVRVGRSF
jgi:hypothetical protein